jgi:alanyl-tRNA synthetase
MTEEQKRQVENIVNEEVLANTPVQTHVDLPIEEAKARGAMALFGEKYGDRVRMVEVGEFSRELCGGTHVRSTGEIGQFRIVSEASAASGVRRIEAITGEAAYEHAVGESRRLQEIAELLKSSSKEVVPAVHRAVEALREERKRRERAEISALGRDGGGGASDASVTDVRGVTLWTRNFGETDPKIAAQAVDNFIASNPGAVGIGVTNVNGRPQFVAKAGAEAQKRGAHAGNLAGAVAKVAGGGGGGSPGFATAGGKSLEKADQALAAAKNVLEAQISV